MRRIAVIGNSGSGKSTLALMLSRRLGLDHVELDAIHHQAGWVPLPDAEFRARVADRLRPDGAWVCDGNYPAVRDIVWARADTVLWLDLPRHVVTTRVVRRSLRRVWNGTPLWNGNTERLGELLRLHDPQRSVIAWSVSRHRAYREQYAMAPADPANRHLRFVRLRTTREVARWSAALPKTTERPPTPQDGRPSPNGS